MSDVPSELCREILLRLPAMSLLRFRSVCKAWQCMIDDPSFIKDHTNNQLYSNTLLVRNGTGGPLYSFSLDSLNFIRGAQQVDASYAKQLINPGMPDLHVGPCMNSCNGLILISHKIPEIKWTIWNPLTGDCHMLPLPSAALGLKWCFLFGCGFGYDRDTDDYKVVSIRRMKDVDQTLVYSLKSGSWRMIETCPCYPSNFCGTFWNGALYWGSSDAIVALNLGTERFCQLTLPPVGDRFIPHVNALDGYLICNVNNYTEKTFDGWAMKDNGVWIKLFSLQTSVVGAPFEFKLVAYLKRKEQVILQYPHGFFWFDIRNNSVLKFSIHDLPYIHSSLIYPGSLVRLGVRGGTRGVRAVTAGSILTMKRKRDLTITPANRLKLCVRDVGDKCCSDNYLCSEDSCRLCKEE